VPISPRLRERIRTISGIAAVDTPADGAMLLGRPTAGALARLVDLTVVGADFAELWTSLAGAIAILRSSGAPVTDDFVAYVDEIACAEEIARDVETVSELRAE
jgi:hypothetical protein